MPGIDVQPNLPVGDVVSSLGIYVEYSVRKLENSEDDFLSAVRDEPFSSRSSAFAVLMNAGKERSHLPPLLVCVPYF